MGRLQVWIATLNWSVLPAPIWWLIASPLLGWALGVGVCWAWPKGASKSPFKRSFWCVGWRD